MTNANFDVPSVVRSDSLGLVRTRRASDRQSLLGYGGHLAKTFALFAVAATAACGGGSSEDLIGAQTDQTEDGVRVCSTRFYRMYNASLGSHFYSIDPDEIDFMLEEGYVVVDEKMYVCDRKAFPSLSPLYRYYNPTTHDYFYTTWGGGRAITGYEFEGAAAYVFTTSTRNRKRLHRFWYGANNVHFYTTFASSVAGHVLEDELIYVYADPPSTSQPPPATTPPPVATPPPAAPQPPVDPLPSVQFAHRFVADKGGDPRQCNGAFSGTEIVPFGQWSSKIRIDTDNRNGGCWQSFGLLDPRSGLSGLRLEVNFYADGDAGQCGNPGNRQLPIVTSGEAQYTAEYRIDTDGRSGGCQQVFSLEGRDDLALDVEFLADGDARQCGNTGVHTAVAGTRVQLRLDTDNRGGGCTQRFRLRRR